MGLNSGEKKEKLKKLQEAGSGEFLILPQFKTGIEVPELEFVFLSDKFYY